MGWRPGLCGGAGGVVGGEEGGGKDGGGEGKEVEGNEEEFVEGAENEENVLRDVCKLLSIQQQVLHKPCWCNKDAIAYSCPGPPSYGSAPNPPLSMWHTYACNGLPNPD